MSDPYAVDQVVAFITSGAAMGLCVGVALRYFRKLRNRRRA